MESDYPNAEILYLVFNDSERFLGMTLGINHFKEDYLVREIVIYKKGTTS